MTSKDYYDEFMDMFSPEEQAEVLGLENWRGTSGLMNGGIASLNGGGSWYGNPHMDPPSSTTPSSPTDYLIAKIEAVDTSTVANASNLRCKIVKGTSSATELLSYSLIIMH